MTRSTYTFSSENANANRLPCLCLTPGAAYLTMYLHFRGSCTVTCKARPSRRGPVSVHIAGDECEASPAFTGHVEASRGGKQDRISLHRHLPAPSNLGSQAGRRITRSRVAKRARACEPGNLHFFPAPS